MVLTMGACLAALSACRPLAERADRCGPSVPPEVCLLQGVATSRPWPVLGACTGFALKKCCQGVLAGHG